MTIRRRFTAFEYDTSDLTSTGRMLTFLAADLADAVRMAAHTARLWSDKVKIGPSGRTLFLSQNRAWVFVEVEEIDQGEG